VIFLYIAYIYITNVAASSTAIDDVTY